MKKTIAILALIALTVSAASADTAEIVLDANPTTGFEWTGFAVGGASAVLDSEQGEYIADPNPDNLCGSGGETHFTVTAVCPGETLLRFVYARSWENEPIEERLFLAVVNDDMSIVTEDVTSQGILRGTACEVNAEDRTVLLNTETHGEVIAQFPGDMEMPVDGESVTVYTDGTMTMSLPGIVNVIGWEAAADGNMR